MVDKKKWITWLLIIFIALLPVPAILQCLQTPIVRNAVVTAYRYEIGAPIHGQAGRLKDAAQIRKALESELPGSKVTIMPEPMDTEQRFKNHLNKSISD